MAMQEHPEFASCGTHRIYTNYRARAPEEKGRPGAPEGLGQVKQPTLGSHLRCGSQGHEFKAHIGLHARCGAYLEQNKKLGAD